MLPTPETLSVSELNRRARQLLESQLDQVWVEGEISNFSRPASGHWYFTLKDANAQIRCAMFRNRNVLVKQTPKAGEQVRVRARVSLYEARGDYQLIAESMQPAGLGALQQAFEALKQRLHQEGLFDESKKQALPKHIQHLAIISSPTGAAVHDILSVLARRNPGINVVLVPAAVQGEGAPAQLRKALAQAINLAPDAIIIGRGGGSLEDLWAFNNELLARDISACSIPIVSAVGHEVDFSICDFVADLRAPTPSAAAELVSGDNQATLQQLARLQRRLLPAFQRRLAVLRQRVQHAGSRLKHPGDRIQQWQQRTDQCELRLQRQIHSLLQQRDQKRQNLHSRLLLANPARRMPAERRQVHQLQQRLVVAQRAQLNSASQRLSALAGELDIVSPLATLKRGYVIVRDDEGALTKSATSLQANDAISLRFHDGDVDARVLATHPKHSNAVD